MIGPYAAGYLASWLAANEGPEYEATCREWDRHDDALNREPEDFDGPNDDDLVTGDDDGDE